MGIFDKFKLGLNKSSKNLSSGLSDLIFKRKIDENMLNELDEHQRTLFRRKNIGFVFQSFNLIGFNIYY